MKTGEIRCQCGAGADPDAGPGLPSLNIDSAPKPNLDFSIPTLNDSRIPGLERMDLSGLSLDFDDGRGRGRAYRALYKAEGPALNEAPLHSPFGIAWLPDNTFYAADFPDSGRVRVLRCDGADGRLLGTVRRFGDDAPDMPAGMAADDGSNFFIADSDKCVIGKYDASGRLLTVYGGPGVGATELTDPGGVAAGPDGALYISDTGNNRVLCWDSRGNMRRIIGINEMDEDNGWLRSGSAPGEFDEPVGIALDGAGNVYVADSNNHRIQKFTAAGECALVFGEEGDQAGRLLFPTCVGVGVDGGIFVSDLNGSRIQRFDGDGHFVYELMFPGDSGSVSDFLVAPDGRILVALRHADAIVMLEVD